MTNETTNPRAFVGRTPWLGIFGLLAGSGLLACADEAVGTARDSLVAICVEPSASIPAGAWACGESLIVECTGELTAVAEIHAETAAPACAMASQAVSDSGPYEVGVHTIEVVEKVPGPNGPVTSTLCTSELAVVDTTPPTAVTHELELWPPNHKLHEVSIDDCVTVSDLCDPTVEVVFTYASSDEPVDDIGDGNHEPDIVDVACDRVTLRAERQGPEDGRVYTLGWRATDGAGNVLEGECQAVVPHDQGKGSAIDSGASYTVAAPSDC